MKNVIVIFGGASVEHDISILTGLHAARNILDGQNVNLVYITRKGQMVTSGAMGLLSQIDKYINNKAGRAPKCFFSDGELYKKRGIFLRRVCKIDAVINCCHGGAGENGQLAAMFDAIGIPITSCDYVSAANLQSKTRTREILEDSGFFQPKYTVVRLSDYENHKDDVLAAVSKLEFPLIVKPDTLGSSIGITVVKTEPELAAALELVFTLDDKAIAEQFFAEMTEINCAAFRAKGKIWTSKCEILQKNGQILDFSSKYLEDSGFIKTPKTGQKKINMEESEGEGTELFAEIQSLTRKAYELFNARGVVRADFMVVTTNDKTQICLNEINTVPGFLAYHLWHRAGIPYGVLLDMVTEQAVIDAEKHHNTVFASEILQKNRVLVE